MEEVKNAWGGKRTGAGRPVGTTKEVSVQRPQHQLRALPDEWELLYNVYQRKRGEIMKEIVKATDVLAAGFLALTIYSGLLSTQTGGKLLFGYLVIRFILKNAVK